MATNQNIILNSSFEIVTAPDMPDGWSHAMHYPGAKRDFYQAIRVVEDNPYHGKRCFMLKDGGMRYLGGLSWSEPINTPLVLSMYLRTDQPGAELQVLGQTLKPDGEWKRYSLDLKPGTKSNFWVCAGAKREISFKGKPDFWVSAKGAVYLDALQMERGETPSEYRPDPRDQVLTALPVPLPLTPEVKLGADIEFTGKVPWPKGLAIPALQADFGKKAAKETHGFIVKGKDALHVRFECHGRTPDNLVTNVQERDDYVFADDSVGVVLNPGFENGRDASFLFEVSAGGVQRDAYGVDASWDADWPSAVGKLDDGYWAELTIPYAALNDVFATGRWQINLLRHSAARPDEKREVSAWFNPGIMPVERTGMTVSGFTGLEKYQVSIGRPAVSLCHIRNSAPARQYAVGIELGLAADNSRQGKALLSLPSGTKWRTNWKSANGKAELLFTSNFSADKISDLKNYTLTVMEKGVKIAERCFNERLSVPPLLKVGPLDRSYYTTEPRFRLDVAVAVRPALAGDFELDVALLGPMNGIAHKRFPAKSGILSVDLPDLEPGVYRVQVNLVRGNGGAKIFACGELPLTKLDPAPSGMETKVNPISRMMVINGQEYINMGLSVSAGCRSLKAFNERLSYLVPDIDEIKKRFTGISPLYCTLDQDREEVLPLLKDLVEKFHQAGLDVTLGIPSLGAPYSIDDFFQTRLGTIQQYRLMDWPVISWYEFDEAYGSWEKQPQHKEADLLDFYRQLKNLDPYRLFYTDTSYCGRVYGGLNHADWIGGSYYPISLYPPRNIPAGVRGYAMATEKTRAELDAPVVTGGFLPCFAYQRGREPSAREYRCCTYLMLIQGCRAMNLWMYAVFSRSLWDSMIDLKKEAAFLSPIFSEGANVSPLVTGSSRSVDYTVWRHQNKIYLVAANFSPEKLTAAFDLNLLENHNSADEVFEKRPVKIHAGILTAVFEGFGCHIYEIR